MTCPPVRRSARGSGGVASAVMVIGAVLLVGAYAWAQVPQAPYLVLGLVAVVGVLAALAGLVLWWARR